MLQIMVDGQNISYLVGAIDPTKLGSVANLVELVKVSIDPERIITDIMVNGELLSDKDWKKTLTGYGDALIEVSTGSRMRYIKDRLIISSKYLRRIISDFSSARRLYQNGNYFSANKELKICVQNLDAYISWYATLLAVDKSTDRQFTNLILDKVQAIKSNCQKITQLMLYNSWWIVGETIESELEPQLESMYSVTLSISNSFRGD